MRKTTFGRFAACTCISLVTMGNTATSIDLDDGQCQAVLDGSRFPDLIPEVAVWNELASSVSGALKQTGSQLNISSAAKQAVFQTFTAPDGSSPGSSEGVLQRRDALTRSLSVSDLRGLSDWIDARRLQILYTFPIPGTLGPPNADGTRRCTLSLKGSEHPSLIPEAFYWDAYFRSKADALGEYRGPDGRPAVIYIRAQQEYHLPMPNKDIEIFFEVATRVADQLQRATALEADASVRRHQRARIVQEGRQELVRRLPASSWLVVQTDAQRVRHSAIYDFPTGM